MKKSIYTITFIILLVTGCAKLDYTNPNAPTGDEILNTREGLISLAIGMKQFYSTTGLQAFLLTPGTTAREVKGITTFTNILEIEAGGTALPTFNGNVLALWSSMLRTMGMAEDIINKTPIVLPTDEGMQKGLVVFGKLFKAMTIHNLATAFEQFPIETDETGHAAFVSRQDALLEASNLLLQAEFDMTAVSPEFTSRVAGPDFILMDVIHAYMARVYMMRGQYIAAYNAAFTVALNRKSQFVYSIQSPNPVYQQVAVAINFRPRANFGLPAGFVDPADGRLNFYLSTPDATVGGETLKTLKGFFDAIDKPIPVYLSDEMKLLMAESIVRQGINLPQAVTLINEVRQQASGDPFGVHANLPAYSGAVTVDALLLEIYQQRSAELFLQGLRLEDSRRFNRPAPPTNVNPVPITFERNRNFYPYPDQERLTNPNTPNDPAI